MDEKCWALHPFDHLQIVKPILDSMTQQFSNHPFDNCSQTREGRHENQSCWISMWSQMTCSSSSYRPAEHDDIRFTDSLFLNKIIINFLSIFENPVCISFSFVNSISWILYWEDMDLENYWNIWILHVGSYSWLLQLDKFHWDLLRFHENEV